MFSGLDHYRHERKISAKKLSVLDIGCGTGRIGKEIQKRGYQVTGLDFSSVAVSKAKKLGINAKLCDIDAGLSTETSHAHDVVWAGDIIEHVFDPLGLLREVKRVLKKEGALLLSIPSDVGIVSRIKMLLGISYQEQMYRRSGFYKHHTFFNLRLITYMLAKTGFRIVSTEKLLISPNKKRYRMNGFPSAFYNEIVITAKPNE